MKRERSFLAMGDQVVGLGGHKGVGFGERVSQSSVGVESGMGAVPPFQTFLNFPLEMVHSGALFVLFSTVNWHNTAIWVAYCTR